MPAQSLIGAWVVEQSRAQNIASITALRKRPQADSPSTPTIKLVLIIIYTVFIDYELIQVYNIMDEL